MFIADLQFQKVERVGSRLRKTGIKPFDIGVVLNVDGSDPIPVCDTVVAKNYTCGFRGHGSHLLDPEKETLAVMQKMVKLRASVAV